MGLEGTGKCLGKLMKCFEEFKSFLVWVRLLKKFLISQKCSKFFKIFQNFSKLFKNFQKFWKNIEKKNFFFSKSVKVTKSATIGLFFSSRLRNFPHPHYFADIWEHVCGKSSDSLFSGPLLKTPFRIASLLSA